jgi:hypothetical protein
MLRRGGATDGSVCEVLPGMLAGLLGFLQVRGGFRPARAVGVLRVRRANACYLWMQTWIIYVVATCIIPGLYLGSIRGLDHLQTYEITHVVVSILNHVQVKSKDYLHEANTLTKLKSRAC